jgi:hypothetical protein
MKLEWVLTIANATGTNGLTYLPKHGGARDTGHLSYDWLLRPVLSFRDRTPSALTARPSSSSHTDCPFKSEFTVKFSTKQLEQLVQIEYTYIS